MHSQGLLYSWTEHRICQCPLATFDLIIFMMNYQAFFYSTCGQISNYGSASVPSISEEVLCMYYNVHTSMFFTLSPVYFWEVALSSICDRFGSLVLTKSTTHLFQHNQNGQVGPFRNFLRWCCANKLWPLAHVTNLHHSAVKFFFSKKATKIDKIFIIASNRWWIFCQFLWPS